MALLTIAERYPPGPTLFMICRALAEVQKIGNQPYGPCGALVEAQPNEYT